MHRWKQSRAVVLTVIAGVVLVVGSVGFALQYPDDRPVDSFYRALQLFAFGGNVTGSPNLWLEIARFLAPLVVGYAAVNVVLDLYRDQVRWFRIRGLRDHVVIAGLGQSGVMMASSFDREGWRVIAVERDASNTAIQSARERGIWAVQGDATDPHVLRRAGAARAAVLVVMCGDDGTDIDVATVARRVCRERTRGILTTVVDLDDLELWQIMKAQALVEREHSAFRLELFNARGLAAEMLIDERPPFRAEQKGDAHVLMVGMEGVGMSLAVEILKRWQAIRPSCGQRLRLTIADRAPETVEATLRAGYPEIAAIAGVDLRTWCVDVESAGRITHVPEGVSAIYVCLAGETRALTTALSLRQHPDVWDEAPIVLAVSDENAGVGAAIRRSGRALDHVAAFGVHSRTLTPDALLHTATEVIARLGHEHYCQEQFARGHTEASDPSLVPWERLTPDLRESNRLWADGLAAHLSYLRLAVTPAPLMSPDEPVLEFADDEVECLAPLEHQRWVYAMKRIGYRHGVTRTSRTHPMIDVPFDQLPEANKDKDRAHVRAIPSILAKAGFRIARLDADSGSAHRTCHVSAARHTAAGEPR